MNNNGRIVLRGKGYIKKCATCKTEITKQYMQRGQTIAYCQFLSDDTTKDYTCNYVECLKCKLHNAYREEDERVGRRTRSRRAVAV